MPKMTNDGIMTNDEAIKLIQDDIRLHHDYLSSKYKKALRIAIESLQTDMVRCKNCIHRHTYECPMYHEEWHTVDEGDGYFDDDLVIFDWTVDDGYCHLGDTEGDGDE